MSHWPLVVVGSGNTASTDEESRRFIEEQSAMLARGEPFVELADMTRAQMVNVPGRERAERYFAMHERRVG